MTPHEVALLIFGAGLGSVATMFLTAYFMVREFERRGGYAAGPKTSAELRRPPRGPAPGGER